MVAVKAYRGGDITVTHSGIQKCYVVTDLKNKEVFRRENAKFQTTCQSLRRMFSFPFL